MFIITDIPLPISFLFLFVLTAWLAGIKFGQGSLFFPFTFTFPLQWALPKGIQWDQIQHSYELNPTSSINKLFHFWHKVGTTWALSACINIFSKGT